MNPLGSTSASGEGGDSIGESGSWYPAQEWLEDDDEQDMDYHPTVEMDESDDGDAWEEMSVEDEDLDVEVTDGENHTRDILTGASLIDESLLQKTRISISAIFKSSSPWTRKRAEDKTERTETQFTMVLHTVR